MPSEYDYHTLNHGLEALGLQLSGDQKQQLLRYLQALAKWNRVYNLTAITDPRSMIHYHLIDSLAIQAYIQGPCIIDVGTGAGLPGIPLAILHNDHHFVLLDAAAKKIRFLKHIQHQLGLDNIEPVHSRCEQYSNNVIFDTIVTRAVGSIETIQNQVRHLAGQGTRWLLMRGQLTAHEQQLVQADYQIKPLTVPGVDRKRYIVWADE